MGTKNNPGQFDCYANAAPDEPMFILLGRDRHAPALVHLWSVMRQLEGESTDKIQEAIACRDAMMAYAEGLGKTPAGIGQPLTAGLMHLVLRHNTLLSEVKRLEAELTAPTRKQD